MVQIKSALNSERLDLVEHDLREVGFHIIENVISAEEANEAREAIWEMVEKDVNNGRDHSYGNGKIRRVWAIVGKSPIFRKLIQHPTVVAVWKRMLGEDAIASTFTANIVGPGAPAGGWHIDYPYWGNANPVSIWFSNRSDGVDVR